MVADFTCLSITWRRPICDSRLYSMIRRCDDNEWRLSHFSRESLFRKLVNVLFTTLYSLIKCSKVNIISGSEPSRWYWHFTSVLCKMGIIWAANLLLLATSAFSGVQLYGFSCTLMKTLLCKACVRLQPDILVRNFSVSFFCRSNCDKVAFSFQHSSRFFFDRNSLFHSLKIIQN